MQDEYAESRAGKHSLLGNRLFRVSPSRVIGQRETGAPGFSTHMLNQAYVDGPSSLTRAITAKEDDVNVVVDTATVSCLTDKGQFVEYYINKNNSHIDIDHPFSTEVRMPVVKLFITPEKDINGLFFPKPQILHPEYPNWQNVGEMREVVRGKLESLFADNSNLLQGVETYRSSGEIKLSIFKIEKESDTSRRSLDHFRRAMRAFVQELYEDQTASEEIMRKKLQLTTFLNNVVDVPLILLEHAKVFGLPKNEDELLMTVGRIILEQVNEYEEKTREKKVLDASFSDTVSYAVVSENDIPMNSDERREYRNQLVRQSKEYGEVIPVDEHYGYIFRRDGDKITALLVRFSSETSPISQYELSFNNASLEDIQRVGMPVISDYAEVARKTAPVEFTSPLGRISTVELAG